MKKLVQMMLFTRRLLINVHFHMNNDQISVKSALPSDKYFFSAELNVDKVSFSGNAQSIISSNMPFICSREQDMNSNQLNLILVS